MSRTVEEGTGSLAASRELVDAILANLADGIVVFGRAGELLWGNEQAARLVGYASPEAMVQARAGEVRARFELFDEDGVPFDPLRLPHQRALAGEDTEPVIIRFRRPGGPERVSEVRSIAIRDEAGVTQHAISFFHEVTREHRLVEEQRSAAGAYATLYREAQRTTALLDALYGSAPVGLGFWDRDLRYVRVNEALAAINERSAEEHVGRTFQEVIPQLAHILEPIVRRVLDTGEAVIALEMTGGTPKRPAEVRHWRASYYPVIAAGGEVIGVGAVVEETTARRRAEVRTELQHAVARILNEAETVALALPLVLETICGLLQWEVACYWSVDPDEPRVIWARPGSRIDGFVAMTERSLLSPAMLPGRVAAAARPEWLTELEPERFARASVAAAEGLLSGAAFPVIVEGEVVGVLEAFAASRQPYDEALERALAAVGAQIGQFLRRKRVEDERQGLLIRERQARAEAEAAAQTLRKLGRVSEVALEQHSLHDLLNALLVRLVEVLEADSAAILLLDDRDERLHVRATVGLEAELEHAVAIPLGAGMAGRVAASRRPLLVPDLSQIDLVSPVLRDRGINSLVAIPLIVEDRVIGVVNAGSEAYAQFTEEDQRLLELIADRIALAINQAALFEAERLAQERLQFLGEASTLLASSLDVEATLRRVAQLAVPHFADWCAVDLGGERVAFAGSEEEQDETVVGSLVARDRELGTLTFGARSPARRFDETDRQFAQEIAARAAVAVDNAELYRAAERRRDRLGFLAEASALLGASLDVDRTLDELSALLADRFADWTAIHLVQADGCARLTSVGHRDPDRLREARREIALAPADRELPSAVAQALESGVSTRWSSSGADNPEGSFEQAEGLHSGLIVPLVARSRILGSLSLVRGDTVEPYDDDDLEFAEDIARRAAVALDNAQLYREAAHSRDRLGFLAEASALLGASLDVDQTLERLGVLVAGRVADWCAIHLVSETGPPRLVSVAHWDETKSELAAKALEGTNPEPDADTGVGKVIRTGEPELIPVIPPELVTGPARDAGIHSCVIVPLQARGRTFGAISFVWAETDATYDEHDLEFALDLASRAAIAIDNAQLYRAAEERAQAARVLASVGDGVFLVDRNGYVRTWNRAAAAATGLRATDVVDRLAAEAIPGWVSIVTRVPIVAAGSAAPRAESLPLDLGKRELWLSLHGVVVPDGIVYAFRDLTEERALETMRTEFVSTVSHELRTPLAAIYGAAMTLRRSDVALDEEQRAKLLDVVSGEADRLAKTVNDILWASRLDTDSLHVTIQNCDPLALARQVVEAQLVHLDRGHQLVLDAPDELPPVASDPDKVGRVLINLVDNAVKYSPDGGRVDVAVALAGSRVRFSITDQGLGVPVSEQRRIFEKFYRLDPNMNRGVGGTGLGLYICRELVRRMEGRIWVESPGVGRGSTFHVELPVASSL